MRLFQQTLQSVLHLCMIARQLVLSTHHRTPKTLFHIRYEAEDQFLGHQPFHQSFGVGEIFLPSPPPAIGLRLCQMQCSRHGAGAFSLLAARLPVPLQCPPNRFPILRRGFHHHFRHRLLQQPLRQQLQLLGVAAKMASFKLVRAFDRHIGHHYGQHLFVNIDSRYPVRHNFPPGGSGERATS